MDHKNPPSQRQLDLERSLGAARLEAAFHLAPDPSQIREELRTAILAVRRAAELMDKLGHPWHKRIE